jgi:Flp pilus assembly protein TadB
MTVYLGIISLVISLLFTFLVSFLLGDKQTARQAIVRAGVVLLTEKELALAREDRLTRYVWELIELSKKRVNLEGWVLGSMRKMLHLMGREKSAEKELSTYFVKALVLALPILIVPLITGFLGYVLLYPFFVGLLIVQFYRQLKKEYQQWQAQLIRDLPDLIDKLRISFASGRDYIAAFIQIRDHSGMKMRGLIDKLISDLQYLPPAKALDLFAAAFQMPVVDRFVSAVKIAIKYGYQAADNYFQTIENDITEIRCVVIEELTKSKPEKIYQLYVLIFALVISALALKAWELFSQLGTIL